MAKKNGIEYLGQVNMLALETILLLVPMMTINKYLHLYSAAVNNIYMGLVAIIIITEYTRRMKFTGIIPGNPWVVLINGVSIVSFLLYLII